MPLTAGKRLGPYEIVAPIGAGGMGQVFRARDTRLDRTVAVKVLPDNLADDPEFRERFEREARVISQFDHPNICALHDVGEEPESGLRYLVMQHVEGETLADRLARGPLPLAQALSVAIDVAGALAVAHRAGIVHRDLKPGNIMLTKAGAGSAGTPRAVLLDFGLAKAGAVSASNASMLPTTLDAVTAQGTILGTFQYMAPEQLEGLEADGRTDLFAFGAVLYEMLTGRKAFTGKSQASLIGAILHAEPASLTSLQPPTPLSLRRLVEKCLEKDRDERWQSAKDLRDELQWIAGGGRDTDSSTIVPASGAPAASSRGGFASPVLVAVAIAATGAALWLAWIQFGRPGPAAPAAVRFQVSPPDGTTFVSGLGATFALSPDGRQLVFPVRSKQGVPQLAVRAFESLETRLLAGTEGLFVSGGAFWSPDSRFVGFTTAQGSLKKIDVTGGPPQTLSDAQAAGGSWHSDGTILFTPTSNGGIFKIPQVGGNPTPVTTPDAGKGEVSHRFPWFLPDGRRFLFTSVPSGKVFVGSLDDPGLTELVTADSRAMYSDGHLLFVRQNTLMAQPFDVGRLTLTGDAFPVAENVGANPTAASGSMAVSGNGILAYRTGTATELSQLMWRGRTGQEIGTVGAPADQINIALSPDGRRVAVSLLDSSADSRHIAIYDLARNGLRSSLTFNAPDDQHIVWSPDGSQVVFSRPQERLLALYQKSASGAGTETLLLQSRSDLGNFYPTSWTRDGLVLFHTAAVATASSDIWALPLDGERKPVAMVQSPRNESQAQISPNGRWIAYTLATASGRNDVFVAPFSTAGQASGAAASSGWQVSPEGGIWPTWSRDGKELFYLSASADNWVMAAAVNGTGAAFEVTGVQQLFQFERRLTTWRGYALGRAFDVHPDGQRFLVNAVADRATESPVTVVLNWTSAVRR